MNDSNTNQLSNECIPCSNGTCGTGIHNGAVKPGDPLSGVTQLWARSALGGVSVRWDLPSTNAHAVQHIVIFRSREPDLAKAVRHAAVSGDYFFDTDFTTDDIAPAWYWIETVTVNGTKFPLIGPASASPLSLKDETLKSLTDSIDEGMLARHLREDIGKITEDSIRLGNEIIDRTASNKALMDVLAAVQGSTSEAMTLIDEKIHSQSDGLNALVQQMNVLAVGHSSLASAIVQERTVSVSERETLARRIDTLFSQSDSAFAAIRTEEQTRVTQYNTLATRITTLQSEAESYIASVQQSMQTSINTLNNTISSLYSVRLTANGLVGGFGLLNNSQTVEAGFDVDTFWVGRTNADKVKPFTISGGTVYIDKARIRTADIDTLKIAGNAITATNISQGGGNWVGGNSSRVLNEVWIDMGSSGSSGSAGVIVQGHVSMISDGDASMYLQVIRMRDGAQLSVTPSSANGGWYTSFSVMGWDPYPNIGGNGYRLVLGNYTTGNGSNKSASVASSTLIASGGKR